MKKKITIKDVALEAGVSVATVSYIINNKTDQKISEKTRNKVLHTINLLGYKPNSTAQALANKKTKLIALIIPHSDNIFYRSELLSFITKISIYFSMRFYKIIVLDDVYNESIEDFDSIITYDLTKEQFKNIASKVFCPVIAVSSYINDPVFYQINNDYKDYYKISKTHFKNNNFILFTSNITNSDRKKILNNTFPNIEFVSNNFQLSKIINKKIVCFDESIYNNLKQNNDTLFISINYDKIFETILHAVKLAEQRITTDEHNISIKYD